MTLYFKNGYDEERVIGNPDSVDGAHLLITAFLNAHHYKSYYTRIWAEENRDMWFDVGSHSEFFILRKE